MMTFICAGLWALGAVGLGYSIRPRPFMERLIIGPAAPYVCFESGFIYARVLLGVP